jgi:hypothetical protein
MSYLAESRGPSLKESRERERSLSHLRVHGAPNATRENPRWVVSHYAEEHSRKPSAEYDFDSGAEMLRHVAAAANVPEGDD